MLWTGRLGVRFPSGSKKFFVITSRPPIQLRRLLQTQHMSENLDFIQISAWIRLSLLRFFVVFLSPPANSGILSQIRPQPLPSTSIPIHHLPSVLFGAVGSELLKKRR
jgi:hypothetical protein